MEKLRTTVGSYLKARAVQLAIFDAHRKHLFLEKYRKCNETEHDFLPFFETVGSQIRIRISVLTLD